MQNYILRRFLWAVPTLLGAITLIFLLMRVLPGDVVIMVLGGEGQDIDPTQYQALREQLGLNRPLLEQYFDWLWGIIRLDLGVSLWTSQPVWSEISTRLPYTATLIAMALAISIALSIPIGVASALKQDSWLDYALRGFAIAGLSIPSFWFGMLLLILVVTVFNWSPPIEYAPVYKEPWIALQQLFLPAITLGYRQVAISARMMRSTMLEVLREDYVRTAWAKGLTERAVVYIHAMRNAILPVITIFGLEIILLISGTVIIETIFNIPGVGRLLVDGINNRDVNLVQGVTAFIVAIVLATNLIVDLIYAWADPRVRFK
ncbi:ABC transporter permease [Bacteroidota bacterium]